MMKSFEALNGIGMSERQIRKFLVQSRSALLLGTTNPDGTPMIHPVWYYFDPGKNKLYFYTEPSLLKTRNIKKRSQVYFDVDDDKWPYKGVKGRGRARIITAKGETLALGRKILARYVKKGRPLFKGAFEKMESGGYIIIEVTPAYFTSWDFGKLERQDRSLRGSIIS
jgi:PPOX class probable F420-dependent enzyme